MKYFPETDAEAKKIANRMFHYFLAAIVLMTLVVEFIR